MRVLSIDGGHRRRARTRSRVGKVAACSPERPWPNRVTHCQAHRGHRRDRGPTDAPGDPDRVPPSLRAVKALGYAFRISTGVSINFRTQERLPNKDHAYADSSDTLTPLLGSGITASLEQLGELLPVASAFAGHDRDCVHTVHGHVVGKSLPFVRVYRVRINQAQDEAASLVEP